MTLATSPAAAEDRESSATSGASGPQHERRLWLLGFLCLLIPILPAYVVPPGPLKGHGSPPRAIAVLLLGLVILGFLVVRRTARTKAVRPGVLLMVFYAVLQLLVYAVGLTHVDSVETEENKTRVIILTAAYIGLTLYVLTRVQTVRQRSVVLGCLAVGLTFSCAVGVLQQTGLDLRFLFQPPGWTVNLELMLVERFGAIRSMGTSIHPLEFSVLAAITVPLTVHFARYGANRSIRSLARIACGIALLAVPVAISRSGLVALAAAFLIYMWTLKVRHLLYAAASVVAAVLACAALLPSTTDALWRTIVGAEHDTSITERIADYAQVSSTFRDHPIFGLGLGGSLPTEYGYLDNEWLQVIVQGGAVGLAAFLMLAFGGVFGICAAWRRASTSKERDQAYAVGAMFVGILASSFTMDLFSCAQATMILLVSFGLLWSNFTVPLPAFAAQGADHGVQRKSPVSSAPRESITA